MLALWVLRDEPGLRRAARRLAAGGALGSVAVSLLVVSGLPAGWLPLFPAALAAAAIAGCAPFATSWSLRALTAGALGAVGLGLTRVWATSWLAQPAADALGLAGVAALGAASGLALVLGLLPRHLVARPLRLWWAAGGARAGHDDSVAAGAPADTGELDTLVARGIELWARVEQAGPGAEVKAALATALARLFAVARRWRELSQPGILPATPVLRAASALVERRRDEAADPVTRARYADAHRSLQLQASHLDTIAASRERLLSHLHRHLATMEALHLASVTARSADAARNTEALRPMLEQLAHLGDELDAGREVERV
jgi:hypothetical protein